jgi:Domain of unknown function (DUF4126)
VNVSSLVNGVGSMGLFSARVFLPAFLTALLLRFGADIPVLNHFGLLLQLPHGQPTWFTSNASLIVLGILSVAEILAQKNPEARRFLAEFDAYLKAAMSLLTSFGVISATDASFVQQTVHQAGFGASLIPVLVAIGTFRLANIRKEVFTAVYDHVEGTHLEHLLNWFEEAWVTFGTFFLILFPVLMLILIGIATAVLLLVRQRLETLEEQTKIPCTSCGTSIYRCAVACPACHQKIAEPAAIGFLGQSKFYPTDDVANHPYRLAEKRRCPVCAARRPPRRPMEPCQTCNNATLAEPPFTQAYLDYMDRQLPVVLGMSFLFSLVPIFGLIVGTVYYRMELILPFSQYLPLGRRFLLRWGIRLLFLILIFFQWVPLLGGFVVPLMAFISFTAYRSVYKSYMLTPSADAIPVTNQP